MTARKVSFALETGNESGLKGGYEVAGPWSGDGAPLGWGISQESLGSREQEALLNTDWESQDSTRDAE